MRMLIHPFVPSARATSPCDPAKSAQTVPLPNGSKTADRSAERDFLPSWAHKSGSLLYQFLVLTRTLADRRGIHLLSVNKPLFLAPLLGSKLVYIVWFAFNLVLYLVYLLFSISNTYYLKNHFVCFCFYLIV
jgi:hypothetical protein